MENKEAWTQLMAVLEERPEKLRIITALPDPQRRTQDARDPAYFVLEQVTRVDPVAGPGGLLCAVGEHGALTIGEPAPLLVRLLEWNHFDPAAPERTHERTLAAL